MFPIAIILGCESCGGVYLAEEADVKTKRLGVPRAGVHVVSDQQYQLQELAEAFTLLHLLASERHVHDVRPDVVHLLLERQLEQDAIETRPQQFYCAHLGEKREMRNNVILMTDQTAWRHSHSLSVHIHK